MIQPKSCTLETHAVWQLFLPSVETLKGIGQLHISRSSSKPLQVASQQYLFFVSKGECSSTLHVVTLSCAHKLSWVLTVNQKYVKLPQMIHTHLAQPQDAMYAFDLVVQLLGPCQVPHESWQDYLNGMANLQAGVHAIEL